jgi:hypothetical protein
MAASKKPVHEIRMGRIRAAVWENDTKNGTVHNVTVSRLYKDDNDKWSDSTSFGRDDLPVLGKVADKAHDWIFEQSGASEG